MSPHSAAVQPKGRGRHRSVEAESAILKATLYLLQRKPLRKVSADAIAAKAGVSKATIYKWWPNKSLVALDAFLGVMTERVGVPPDTGSAEQDFILQMQLVIAFYLSPLGKIFSQFIAEGQSDPEFLKQFRERFLYARRDAARIMWERGVQRGEVRGEVDSEIVLDLIYGPMIFRLLVGHGSLSNEEAATMVRAVFKGLQHIDLSQIENRNVVGGKRTTMNL
ncbi:TetR/AcrR family transcriptional regulator [Edaphobacter albus]|uniref:TetR/AcrR family transcriptional regulator n=1 Tax=Edaphobacter sp. 4G125 TaxID=2763071 RepID=UPI0016445B13|nr:TetR/AcrR family transcriptional regulator [Edaphobacter sp. 4G125]QNI35450.1 TetR/AcrR family transcriptional regulator [Edaphobacter sp. 4G125]